MTCPSGNPKAALSRMTEQALSWVNTATESKLPRRSIWFMVSWQFWPRVGYRISCNTATLGKLKEALRKPYYQLLPLGGFIRSAPTELRVLDLSSITIQSVSRPAILRSEFVRVPHGFASDTTLAVMLLGHCRQNTVGGTALFLPIITPPTP